MCFLALRACHALRIVVRIGPPTITAEPPSTFAQRAGRGGALCRMRAIGGYRPAHSAPPCAQIEDSRSLPKQHSVGLFMWSVVSSLDSRAKDDIGTSLPEASWVRLSRTIAEVHVAHRS